GAGAVLLQSLCDPWHGALAARPDRAGAEGVGVDEPADASGAVGRRRGRGHAPGGADALSGRAAGHDARSPAGGPRAARRPAAGPQFEVTARDMKGPISSWTTRSAMAS